MEKLFVVQALACPRSAPNSVVLPNRLEPELLLLHFPVTFISIF
jgi:hypothetical protein